MTGRNVHMAKAAPIFSAGWCLRWIPAILWMCVIFGFSTDTFSAQHTSRIIGPFLRWLNPQVSEDTIQAVQLIVRKGGHLSEYAMLGFLICRARGRLGNRASRQWRWDEFTTCLLCGALYALTDEFHQSFVASREGQLKDVLIDSTGAAIGITVWWLAVKLWNRKTAN